MAIQFTFLMMNLSEKYESVKVEVGYDIESVSHEGIFSSSYIDVAITIREFMYSENCREEINNIIDLIYFHEKYFNFRFNSKEMERSARKDVENTME